MGQGIKNTTSRDGTPVTFSWPVDVGTVKAEYFRWHFSDGTARNAECAVPHGGPSGEPNELQTIAIIGDAGGWGTVSMTKLEIVGPLVLIVPTGTKVSVLLSTHRVRTRALCGTAASRSTATGRSRPTAPTCST